MTKSVNTFVYWTPRILSILFVVFISLFSLDVFSSELTFWQIILGLLMHNIPTFILLIILLISWKHEIVGGIFFILVGLAYIIIARNFISVLLISGPAILIGILFTIGWFKKKKMTDKQ